MIHTFEGLSEAQREAVQLSNRNPHKVVSVTKTLSHGRSEERRVGKEC